MARALQKQKSNIIGLIVPSVAYEFFGLLTEGVEEVCHELGYKLMVARSCEKADREVEMVSMLEGNKVDGSSCAAGWATRRSTGSTRRFRW